MRVIIVGGNRVEFLKIKRKDYDKRALDYRGQLYHILPQNLIRMRYYDEKGRPTREPEEVIIFEEGSSVPYDTLPVCYDAYYQENVFPMLDIIRNSRRLKKNSRLMTAAFTGWKALAPYMGLLMTGAIVLFAILFG